MRKRQRSGTWRAAGLRLAALVALLPQGGRLQAAEDASDCARGGALAVQAQLEGLTRQRLDAIAPGDWSVWDRQLDERVIYAAEDGRVYTKAQLKEEFKPLPPGYSGRLEPSAFVVRLSGGSAVVHHEDVEHQTVYDQPLVARYRTTDSYVCQGGSWKLIASQVLAFEEDPPATAVATSLLQRYVGRYELAPSVSYGVVGGRPADGPAQRTREAGIAGRVRERILCRGAAGTEGLRPGRGRQHHPLARSPPRAGRRLEARFRAGARHDLRRQELHYRYESGLEVTGDFKSPTELSWEALTGPAKGTKGTEEIRAIEVAPNVFFISWLEGSGTSVSQILDLERGRAAAFVSFDTDQGRRSAFDQGTVAER